mgnify:CR=1 FL=1
MPQVGLRNAFGVLALTLALLALWMARQSRWSLGLGAALGVSLPASLLFFLGNDGWRHVMSSGMFRVQETVFDPTAMARRSLAPVAFPQVAMDATGTVTLSYGIANLNAFNSTSAVTPARSGYNPSTPWWVQMREVHLASACMAIRGSASRCR